MGSSRDIAIGPVAVVSLLLGTLLQNEIDPQKNPAEYLRLTYTATFFAGITQATLGICRYSLILYSKNFDSLVLSYDLVYVGNKFRGLIYDVLFCIGWDS